MDLFVLSTRKIVRMPSNGCAAEFEDTIVEVTGARLLAPGPSDWWSRVPHGFRRIAGTSRSPLESAQSSAKDRALLVVGLWTDLVEHVREIPRWRDEFAIAAAYVIDPWGAWNKRPAKLLQQFDRVFVPDVRVAERFQTAWGIKAEAVPLSVDVLRFGCDAIDRPLDVCAYGRQHPDYIRVIEAKFNDPRSPRFLFHDTTTGVNATSFTENRRLIWKLLHKSRCALAFDPVRAPGGRKHDRTVIPLRYYEAVAAGAAIVGMRPGVPEMAEQFGWTDATIEIPDDPREAVPFLESLLDDRARLTKIHRRNHREALRRHDTRYRIRDMWRALGIPLGPGLEAGLAALAAASVRADAMQAEPAPGRASVARSGGVA